jgi:cholesterol transport system auxiliary component
MRIPGAAAALLLASTLSLSGCGGLFESKLDAPQTYVLRLPPTASVNAAGAQPLGSVLVQRPETSPGLNSDLIALLRSDRRFDYFSATRWAAPLPDVAESVIVDALRGTGAFSAVMDDTSPFAPNYNLRVTLRRFEADYTAGDAAPTVHVILDCTLGRHRDRALMGSFTAQGSVRASEDRITAVVAAFEAATATAMAELTRATTSALSSDKQASDKQVAGQKASEGR